MILSNTTVPQYKWARMLKEICGNRCVICGSTEKLEAHHIEPRSMRPDLANDLNNGICLCHTCHWLYHNGNYGNNPKIDHNYIQPLDKTRFKMVQEFKENCTLLVLTAEDKKRLEKSATATGESLNGFITTATLEKLDAIENRHA